MGINSFFTYFLRTSARCLKARFLINNYTLGGEMGRKKKNFADFYKILKVLIFNVLRCLFLDFYFTFLSVFYKYLIAR